MSPINVCETAAELPQTWRSHLLGRFGDARLKVLRMDELPVVEEAHAEAEALLVLDGRLELVLAGQPVTVRRGELCVVPAGVPHAVAAGSGGTLLLVTTGD
ncbi:cupin domain-containing protein [Kitasatospora sp. NPDC088134]|uniref:cupin domain-containing protein n=1 Tax=Kitasatospora sp. NPDC088134 TaxID=3364071 RepID=UPI00382F306A